LSNLNTQRNDYKRVPCDQSKTKKYKHMKKIVLLGYMGSGKSTIGLKLSKKMGLKFIDLDDFIAEKEKLSISAIFDQKGEAHFRTLEKDYLKEVLKIKEDCVIALGGGTPTIEGAFELLHEYAITFYLKASKEALSENLKPKRAKRPILSKLDDAMLLDFVELHLNQRMEYYEKADFKILTDDKKNKEIVKEIKLKLTM